MEYIIELEKYGDLNVGEFFEAIKAFGFDNVLVRQLNDESDNYDFGSFDYVYESGEKPLDE